GSMPAAGRSPPSWGACCASCGAGGARGDAGARRPMAARRAAARTPRARPPSSACDAGSTRWRPAAARAPRRSRPRRTGGRAALRNLKGRRRVGTSMRRLTLILTALITLLPTATASADTLLVADPSAANVTVYGSTAAWSRRADDGTYRLVVRDGGQVADAP